jgi:hypothetical protein
VSPIIVGHSLSAGALLRIGYRDHLSVIRGFRPCNEAFGAVDNVMIAILHGPRLHPRWIASGIGFGLGEANPLLAADHRQEKPLFLFFVAVKEHRSYFRPKDRRVTKRYGHRSRHLFHDHAAAHEIEPGATIFRWNIEQPKTDSFGFLLERLDKLLRHVLAFRATFAFQGNQLSVDEFANSFF